jgi:hypothetical protein
MAPVWSQLYLAFVVDILCISWSSRLEKSEKADQEEKVKLEEEVKKRVQQELSFKAGVYASVGKLDHPCHSHPKDIFRPFSIIFFLLSSLFDFIVALFTL